MFKTFRSVFAPDEGLVVVSGDSRSGNVELDSLLTLYGGASFKQGLYRILRADTVARWGQCVCAAFPKFKGRLTCFGVDWLGRVFALDSGRLVEGEPGVVMLEPGTGEALEIPCGIVSFHEVELIDYREEALAESFHAQWRSTGGSPPLITQCVGYKRPLFLGGSDTIDNLELTSLDVYWELARQLLEQTRGVPIGTVVDNITI